MWRSKYRRERVVGDRYFTSGGTEAGRGGASRPAQATGGMLEPHLHTALVHGATRQGWSKGSDDAVMS